MSISPKWPFHTVHGVLQAKILKWFAIPFPSGPRFVRTLHHYRSEERRVGTPKTDGSWWRGLTECGLLEKGMANHFTILVLKTP